MDVDIAFSRLLLSKARQEVKKRFPSISILKDGWVWHFIRDNWEFHGPNEFYWWGSAGNAYEARYKGWMAWLKFKGL